jgi:hypothetical protein
MSPAFLRLTIVAAVAALSACQHPAPAVFAEPQPDAAAELSQGNATQTRVVSGQPHQAAADRQIVRTGRMSVEVSAIAHVGERLDRIVAALSAHVVRSTIGEKSATYVIRVPAAQLDAAMDSVATVGDVESRTVSAADVTNQVVDTEARLAVLRATRGRLQQLLDRTASVADIVTVERELNRVQAELESLEQRLALLRGQVAMSELAISFRQRPVLGPLGVIVVGAANLLGKLFVLR